LVQKTMDRLQATREKLDGVPKTQARIAAMQARIEEFTELVRNMCGQLAPEFVEHAPELAAERLGEQFEAAAAAQQDHEQTSDKIADKQQAVQILAGKLERLAAERQALLDAAQTTSEEAFQQVIHAAGEMQHKKRRLDELVREIAVHRGSDPREAFEQELQALDHGVLAAQVADWAARIQQLDTERTQAASAAAVAASQLKQLDTSLEAAHIADTLAGKRAALSGLVERYIPVMLAQHVLQQAIERFERENQPEMIGAVSGLLKIMTGGRYVAFERSRTDAKGILVRRADGAERLPTQLSTGTREQLYLAIRLAYVLHYCRQNEPLPVVIDDVLVNFDHERARHTLEALVEMAGTAQVLFFTCHQHMVALAREVVPGLEPIEIGRPDIAIVS
jgi:uncharacterized protein YhaN